LATLSALRQTHPGLQQASRAMTVVRSRACEHIAGAHGHYIALMRDRSESQ
jgi:hypothetical protein